MTLSLSSRDDLQDLVDPYSFSKTVNFATESLDHPSQMAGAVKIIHFEVKPFCNKLKGFGTGTIIIFIVREQRSGSH